MLMLLFYVDVESCSFAIHHSTGTLVLFGKVSFCLGTILLATSMLTLAWVAQLIQPGELLNMVAHRRKKRKRVTNQKRQRSRRRTCSSSKTCLDYCWQAQVMLALVVSPLLDGPHELMHSSMYMIMFRDIRMSNLWLLSVVSQCVWIIAMRVSMWILCLQLSGQANTWNICWLMPALESASAT